MRRLTLALVAVYAALGTVEVVVKAAEESAVITILFFGGTLLGGAGLVTCGLYAPVSTATRRALVILGACTGLLASAWTLVVPVLALTVAVAHAGRQAPGPAPAEGVR